MSNHEHVSSFCNYKGKSAWYKCLKKEEEEMRTAAQLETVCHICEKDRIIVCDYCRDLQSRDFDSIEIGPLEVDTSNDLLNMVIDKLNEVIRATDFDRGFYDTSIRHLQKKVAGKSDER